MKDFAKKLLSDVPSSQEFLLHYSGNKRIVKNLLDLRTELEHMGEDEFVHHVNEDRNDFAKWIEDAVGDEKLAHDVSAVTTREEIILLIKSRVEFAVSIIEKENKKLLEDETKRLKEVSESSTSKRTNKQVKGIEKDIKRMTENMDMESRIIESEDDVAIVPWHVVNKVPVNARILEFLFGMVIGFMLGLLIAKAFFGL